MMNAKSKRSQRRNGLRLIAAGLAFIAVIVAADSKIRPIVQKTGGYQCQITAQRIVDNAVCTEIGGYNYANLVELSRDSGGNIVSIESNMANINLLKARVTQLVNEDIGKIQNSGITIPLGTISGVNVLYGRGPGIPVNMTPKGFASVSLVSKFSSAGINQTLHQITLNVSVEISASMSGYTTPVFAESEFIVAQTVIVGYVPESYTHVILG